MATRALRLAVAAIAVGLLSGLSSAAFLEALDYVTDVRERNEWLVWFLPVAGVATGLVYLWLGGRAAGGTRLAMTEIDELEHGVPLRMAPLVFGGTVATQLFGGSAGREGTALQMSASLTDGLARRMRLDPEMRRGLLIASLAGGFGSVFGVPWAGVVFAVEVAPTGWSRRFVALPAAIVAAVVGDALVEWLGVTHTPYPEADSSDVVQLLKFVLCGVAFGLAARVFVTVTEGIRGQLGRRVAWAPGRPGLGGVVVAVSAAVLGTSVYLGLSLPLLEDAVNGVQVATWAFAAKLAFTAVTVGSGFQGGEVTPLFVIGATLGSTMARLLDLPRGLAACVGVAATFGAAAHAPVACVVMGVELFGWRALPALVLACGVARIVASPHHLYERLERAVPI